MTQPMTQPMTQHTAETSLVGDFVQLVRLYLGDLDDEVREELTDGLAADMGDLVAERGPAALPDPEAYADELRLAAGLPARVTHRLPRPRGSLGRRDLALRLCERGMDGTSSRFLAFVDGGRRRPVWELVATMRPAWWVVRAWTAVQCVDILFGGYPHTMLPSIQGQEIGSMLWAGATLVSVQVGRGRWWPGRALIRDRVLLLALNATAIVATPWAVGETMPSDFEAMSEESSVTERGVYNRGGDVCNIFPYDAEGRPLTGVQLLDQNGRPLDVRCPQVARKEPWVLGDVARWNVFPLGLARTGDFPPLRRDELPAVEHPAQDDSADSGDSRER